MIGAYLERLAVARREPSVGYLFELHRAHVSRITYNNLQIMRAAPAGIDQQSATAEVLAGRNGYCFHLNSAFAGLLRGLGFAVSLHRGYVMRLGETNASLNHLVLVVHDLEGSWFVDAGLGDAIYEPLPLRPGSYQQGPFRYGLEACESRGGWRFVHDPAGSFGAMEFESAGAEIADFAQAHTKLSTAPDSPFKRFLSAQVREQSRVLTMRGCTLITVDAEGTGRRVVDDAQEWVATLTGMGLAGDGLPQMWPQVRLAHEAWLESETV